MIGRFCGFAQQLAVAIPLPSMSLSPNQRDSAALYRIEFEQLCDPACTFCKQRIAADHPSDEEKIEQAVAMQARRRRVRQQLDEVREGAAVETR
jgi:hypothetical protein